MANIEFEQASLVTALTTYLQNLGWTGINAVEINIGFQTQDTIIPPMLGIYFLPSSFIELQMGKTNQKSYAKRVQIDCYMETEQRVREIIEHVANFLDETTIGVVDNNSTPLGIMYCPNSEEILLEEIPPLAITPTNVGWRGVVTSPLQSHYGL